MAIVKRPDKRGKIRYQVRLEGHPARTFDTSREARDYAATLRRKRKRRYVMTCSDLVRRYNGLWTAGRLPHQSAPPKQSTLSTRHQHLSLFLVEFGNDDSGELDPLKVETWAISHPWAVTSVNPIFNYARDFIGIELNPNYAQMARYRIADDGPLFNVEAA